MKNTRMPCWQRGDDVCPQSTAEHTQYRVENSKKKKCKFWFELLEQSAHKLEYRIFLLIYHSYPGLSLKFGVTIFVIIHVYIYIYICLRTGDMTTIQELPHIVVCKHPGRMSFSAVVSNQISSFLENASSTSTGDSIQPSIRCSHIHVYPGVYV